MIFSSLLFLAALASAADLSNDVQNANSNASPKAKKVVISAGKQVCTFQKNAAPEKVSESVPFWESEKPNKKREIDHEIGEKDERNGKKRNPIILTYHGRGDSMGVRAHLTPEAKAAGYSMEAHLFLDPRDRLYRSFTLSPVLPSKDGEKEDDGQQKFKIGSDIQESAAYLQSLDVPASLGRSFVPAEILYSDGEGCLEVTGATLGSLFVMRPLDAVLVVLYIVIPHHGSKQQHVLRLRLDAPECKLLGDTLTILSNAAEEFDSELLENDEPKEREWHVSPGSDAKTATKFRYNFGEDGSVGIYGRAGMESPTAMLLTIDAKRGEATVVDTISSQSSATGASLLKKLFLVHDASLDQETGSTVLVSTVYREPDQYFMYAHFGRDTHIDAVIHLPPGYRLSSSHIEVEIVESVGENGEPLPWIHIFPNDPALRTGNVTMKLVRDGRYVSGGQPLADKIALVEVGHQAPLCSIRLRKNGRFCGIIDIPEGYNFCSY